MNLLKSYNKIETSNSPLSKVDRGCIVIFLVEDEKVLNKPADAKITNS